MLVPVQLSQTYWWWGVPLYAKVGEQKQPVISPGGFRGLPVSQMSSVGGMTPTWESSQTSVSGPNLI